MPADKQAQHIAAAVRGNAGYEMKNLRVGRRSDGLLNWETQFGGDTRPYPVLCFVHGARVNMRHPKANAPVTRLASILFLCFLCACGGEQAKPRNSPFVTISSINELRHFAAQDRVKVRLQPGVYTLDRADSHRFLRFTGRDSHYDLRDVTIRVDTRLFSRFGVPRGRDNFYRVIDLTGERSVLEGVNIETFGGRPGIQSKNKIVNIAASGVVLRDVEITTSGSSPWGYGSLYGISGGLVKKMNGIRIGWPAVGARVIGCRVHMRAMGHGIFVQGARETLIENCHVDGLLRSTSEILAEKSGLAFQSGFKAAGGNYIEGVRIGPDGAIPPDEMIALSEDGIRLYGESGGNLTGATTIRGCTVRRMRRGICTGLGSAADRVIDCEAVDCVAAGFNIGSGDVLESCRANARFSEALSCPYAKSRNARVDLRILDSRGAVGNDLLATINGGRHEVRLHTENIAFVPASMFVALGTRRGYAFYQRRMEPARDIRLVNQTPAQVVRE